MITTPPPAPPWPNQRLPLSQLPAPAVVVFGSSVQLIIVPIGAKEIEGGGHVQVSAQTWPGAGEAREEMMSSYVHLLMRGSRDVRPTGSFKRLFLLVWDSAILSTPPPLRLSAIKSFLKFNTFMACWWQVKATGSTLRQRTRIPSWKVIQESQPSNSRLVADILLRSGTIVR